MPRPTQAKYCPQCHAMNFVDATNCLHCGHQFRTGAAAPPPPDETLNKTQMFMLPPLAQRPDVRDVPPPLMGTPAKLTSFLATLRASRLLPMMVLAAVVTLALLCWVVISLR